MQGLPRSQLLLHPFYCAALRNKVQLFDSYSELQKHDHEVHIYCAECDRSFQSESNLWHHLNSKLHRTSTVVCPGRRCNKSFISPAARTDHFESGACWSGMTLKQLNRLAVQADRNNHITIGGHQASTGRR